ncbi:VOC family protein [Glaciihabitans sp. dw_435]|uniref:VOC family protein n=1 Tax=Glaciihabitans sp. dw_435 TaxID=2720081 RepID=UPI001BD6B098|nr:VOC family protein [Glaciihabitans sp. dw_435]
MLDHLYMSVSNPERSFEFLLAALKPLGWNEYGRFSSGGPGTEVDTFGIADGANSIWLRRPKGDVIEGIYLGIAANSTADVDATHAAALAAGGNDSGAPGPRPQFAEGYYAANFTDVDGNEFEIVNKSWAPKR